MNSPLSQDLLEEIENNMVLWTDAIIKSIDDYKNLDAKDNQSVLDQILHQVMTFTEFLTLAAKYLQHLSPASDFLPLKLHLLSVLKALQVSVKNNDSIATHDLITEELRDNLTRWKITILPLAKSHKIQNREIFTQT
jgi:hypothetical protein